MRKFPILGDLPFLGKLFRNKDKRKERTEVIVFVTPHLRRVETDKNGNYIGIDEPSWNMYEDLEQR